MPDSPAESKEVARARGNTTEALHSEGQRALRLHIICQAALARELGVDRSTVSRWRSGEKRPGPAHAARLHELLGIDPGAWELRPGETAAEGALRRQDCPTCDRVVRAVLELGAALGAPVEAVRAAVVTLPEVRR